VITHTALNHRQVPKRRRGRATSLGYGLRRSDQIDILILQNELAPADELTQYAGFSHRVFPLPVLRGSADYLHRHSAGEPPHAASAAYYDGGHNNTLRSLAVFFLFGE